MQRRNFIQKSAVTAALIGTAGLIEGNNLAGMVPGNNAKFKLKYAPGLGAFTEHVGKDPVENIKFAADQGFRAMFDNGLPSRSIEDQNKIAAEIARQNMELGPFVLYADFKVESMVIKDQAIREMLIKKVNDGVELYKRTGVKWALMVPGRYNERLAWEYQTANVIDILRELSEIAEKGGLTIVLEPLNKRDHPGLFLSGMPQAFAICRGVNSKACKIVDDIYHQQITEGNLIPNIDAAWSEIGAFHCGDNPGRKEPGTGEINFQNVFKHIYEKKYDGIICLEHGNSIKGKEGEQAFIDAYRAADNFKVE